jgi:hypothetical protein
MGIIPPLPSQAFKTYEIRRPIASHYRPATCEEVECAHWRNGWKTIVPMNSEQALYIHSGSSGRAWTESSDGDGMRTFTFAPGQKCFASDTHRVSIERDPIFIARGGDSRGNPLGERRVHARAEDWVEDFALHQDRVKKSREG